jgi:hypothetical protein
MKLIVLVQVRRKINTHAHEERERERSNDANEKRYYLSNKIKGKFEIFIIFNLNEKYGGGIRV